MNVYEVRATVEYNRKSIPVSTVTRATDKHKAAVAAFDSFTDQGYRVLSLDRAEFLSEA